MAPDVLIPGLAHAAATASDGKSTASDDARRTRGTSRSTVTSSDVMLAVSLTSLRVFSLAEQTCPRFG
eukprot:scaffold7994_cov122-Isochrysis_galbana.AAC.6